MDPELDQLVRPPSLAVLRHSRPEGKQCTAGLKTSNVQQT